jgi:predicted nucleic acid-binding protein
MSARYFVDTNILVYCRDLSESEKQPRARLWLEWLWQTRRGQLSMQVLQEYYQVVTRRLQPGLSQEEARDDIRDLLAWRPCTIDQHVLEKAWSLETRFGMSWWDALIVAAAERQECDFLLTEDLQHEQVLGGVVVLNPFLTEVPAP